MDIVETEETTGNRNHENYWIETTSILTFKLVY